MGVLALTPLLLAGCLSWTATEEDGLAVFRADAGSGLQSRLDLPLEVGPDATSFLFHAVLDEGVLGYVSQVRDPSGDVVFRAEDWWSGVRNKTNGGFSSEVLVLNWPVSADDEPLTAGTWLLETRYDTANTPVAATALVEADDDFFEGTLAVELIFASDIADDQELSRGVDRAVSVWSDEIYGPMGITVEVSRRTWDGASELGSPGFSDRELYLDVVGDKELRVVPVLLVNRLTDGVNVFGVAGGIPGPLVGSDRSVVTISVLESAGADLVFSADEERLFAETIAHEVGHFLGLFHPAELPQGGSTVESWDALDDTPECGTFGTCATAVGDNLMFPTPLCAVSNGLTCETFVRQEGLTPSQVGVMQRYVGVD